MLNILLWKMWCWTFYFVKCTCKNAFLHQMHFCTAEHFPLENVRWTFSKGKCTRCVAKMHFCIKCIWCKNAFLQRIKCIFASNAFCRFLTFCKQNVRAASLFFAKQKTQHCLHQMHFCTAEHFPKENVMLNILLRKMYALPKCIWCQNAFWQRIKCILASNAFLHSWTFSFGKCTLNIFQRKM